MKNFHQIIKFCSRRTQVELVHIEKFSDEIVFLQKTYSQYQKECEYLKMYERADTTKLFMFQKKIINFIKEHSENFGIVYYGLTCHSINIMNFAFVLYPGKPFLENEQIDITDLIVFKKI